MEDSRINELSNRKLLVSMNEKMGDITSQNLRLKAAGWWLQAIVEPMPVFCLEDAADVRMWEDLGQATSVEHQHDDIKD